MQSSQQILVVRHGEGHHNATQRVSLRDPLLTPTGQEQAEKLRAHPLLSDCKLLVVSPLSRAVQTAVAAFGERPPCRAIITARHSERWSARCDEGRRKSELVASFPFLSSWEGLDELPEDWTPTRGTDVEWLRCRVPAFLSWLRRQPELRVVVVGHGAFLQGLVGRHLDNCEVAEFVEPSSFLEIVQRRGDCLQQRTAAAEALGELGKAATPLASDLWPFLHDSDPVVRSGVARALGRIGEESKTEERLAIARELAKLLDDTEALVRNRVAEAVGACAGPGAEAIAEQVVLLVDDVDVEVRQSAAWAVGQLLKQRTPGGEASASTAMAVISRRPKSSDENEDRAAESSRKRRRCEASGDCETVAGAVARLLNDSDGTVRYYAAEALGFMGRVAVSTGCATTLARLLHEDDLEVQQVASWALGQLGSAAVAPHAEELVKSLGSADATIRYMAIEALGELGEAIASCAAIVAKRLSDSDVNVRQAAAAAIGKMGRQVAEPFVDSLATLLEDADASPRQSAAEALGRLASSGLSSAAGHARGVLRLLRDIDPDVRGRAAWALAQMRPTSGGELIEKVAELLSDREAAVRLEALQTLKALGEDAAAETAEAASKVAAGLHAESDAQVTNLAAAYAQTRRERRRPAPTSDDVSIAARVDVDSCAS